MKSMTAAGVPHRIGFMRHWILCEQPRPPWRELSRTENIDGSFATQAVEGLPALQAS